jgi:hypothetical protein
MFLRIIAAAFCFSPLYSFSMDFSSPSIQDVDHAWFLAKLVEYKRAYAQRQKHDEVVARLQEKYHSHDSAVARRVGIIRGCYSPRAKL